MNRLLLSLMLAGVFTGSSFAQKTVKFDFQTSQARLLDVNPNTYVKPLIAELAVDTKKGRIRDSWVLDAVELNSRVINGNDNATLQNLRSYAVFKSSEKHSCDVIVAATFDIHLNENGATINVVGYPANFTNWFTGLTSDYEWILLERGQTNDNEAPIVGNPIKK